ncbi:hypothetical protein EJ08DRAFT_150872 [Tothia fuscella]|uniref:Uncharacterized protein n=1 Tax=Tothia fuscella TaxID=1048955 RepID=A0A9P4P3B7_9PEZI|nr:hypothetical protein EJ08DRAFT_150872 [Tothia fuscella]
MCGSAAASNANPSDHAASWANLSTAEAAHQYDAFTSLPVCESDHRDSSASSVIDFHANVANAFGSQAPTVELRYLEHFVAVAFPGASSSRLELITSILALISLLKDHPRDQKVRMARAIRQAVNRARLSSPNSSGPATGMNLQAGQADPFANVSAAMGQGMAGYLQQLCQPMIDRLIVENPRRTEQLFLALENWWAVKGTRAPASFNNVDDLVAYRVQDFGAEFWSAAIVFALDLDILAGAVTDQATTTITRHAWISAASSFDYFSYKSKNMSVFNAVAILNSSIPPYSIQNSGKPAVKQRIATAENDLTRGIAKFRSDFREDIDAPHAPTVALESYLEGVQYFAAGYHCAMGLMHGSDNVYKTGDGLVNPYNALG